LAAPPSNRRPGGGADLLNPGVEWYLWRPCVGIPGVTNPLARWSDMIDGTYTLEDVHQMHCVMDEVIHQRGQAQSE